jgi:ABC-type glycerol-3-phosphate transport system substrate-binding protein
MRRWLIVLALFIPVLATQAQPLTPDDQTIVYWHEWDGPQLEAMRSVVQHFNRTNPYRITVQLVSKTNSGRILNTLRSPKPDEALPNVVGGIFPSNAGGLLDDGLIVPLDAYLAHSQWGLTDAQRAELWAGAVGAFRAGDMQAAWPLGLSANVLAVNREMLTQLGAGGLPDGLDSLVGWSCMAAQSTTPRGQALRGFSLTLTLDDFAVLTAAQGQTLLYQDGVFDFASTGSLRVLAALQTLHALGCTYDAGGVYNDSKDLAYGLTPFAFTSSAGLPFIQNDILDSGSGLTDWTFAPAPGPTPAALLYLRGVAITTHGTPQQQLAAWVFVRYLTTIEAQTRWARGLSYQPVNRAAYDVLGSDFLDENPPYAAVTTMLRRPDLRLVLAPNIIGYDKVASMAFEPLLAAVLAGEDIPSAAQAANAAAAQALAEAQLTGGR